jgi:hypothetical protein
LNGSLLTGPGPSATCSISFCHGALAMGLCILSRLVEKVTSRNLRLRELVTFFDEDGNGSIDHDEFMEGAKKLGLMDVTDDDADSCMRAMGMVDGEVESANLINTYKKYMLKVPMKNCLEIFFALWMGAT